MDILKDNIAIIIAILAIFVEITPIKINPLTFIGKIIGNLLGIGELKEKIDNLESRIDWNDIYAVRSRIIEFDIKVRKDTNHEFIERHAYKSIFKDINKWISYHEKYKELNGEIDIAIENIKEAFKKAKFKD